MRRGAIVLILLAIPGLAIYAWINGRLRAIEKAEAELRGFVELEFKTIADGDAELFRARQDPADPDWQDQQIARYVSPDADQFLPVPGLTPADRPPEIEKVHFFGRTGRVELTYWFQPADNPSTSPLPFQVTWFYRRDDDGTWYHVAPSSGYWGTPHSWHGTRLDVQATRVEAEAIDPIAGDLASLVAQGCRWLGCSQGPQEAGYILTFEDVPAPQVRDNHWMLPALYLAGLPQDEEARAAWGHALKLWTVETLARAQVDDEDVTERVLYRQLVKRLQAELELIEPVAPDVELLTQATLEHRQHPAWRLWQARYDPQDPVEMRLFETEAIALLDLLEERVGAGEEGLFVLLPALDEYYRLTDALSGVFELERDDFNAAWNDHVMQVTGVNPLIFPSAGSMTMRFFDYPLDQPLPPPPIPFPLPASPGDQIAFICSGQIWVGDADGSGLRPLTPFGLQFSGLHWSLDGRWLLTSWYHGRSDLDGYPRSALYLLAADGGEGRLLTDAPSVFVWPEGWSPDGRQAIYQLRRAVAESRVEAGEVVTESRGSWEMRAIDVATNESRELPGFPVWSPDGEHLAYMAPGEGDGSVAWLADADWANAREIGEEMWALDWSPDSSRLALTRLSDEPGESAIAVYDLVTERLSTLVIADDLTEALSSTEEALVIDGVDRSALAERPLDQVWPQGWSADGRQLLVVAQKSEGQTPGLIALATVGVDEPERGVVRVLAFGEDHYAGSVSWSPTDPRRLAFAWWPQTNFRVWGNAYLLDLDAGPVYTMTQTWGASWSPDGAWVAFNGSDLVTIVQAEGQEHAVLSVGAGSGCSEVVWNPVADLSALTSTFPFSSTVYPPPLPSSPQDGD